MKKWDLEEVNILKEYIERVNPSSYKDLPMDELYKIFDYRTEASVREKAKRLIVEFTKEIELESLLDPKVIKTMLRGYYDGVPEAKIYAWVNSQEPSCSLKDFEFILNKYLEQNKKALAEWMKANNIEGTINNIKVAIWLKAKKKTQVEIMALKGKLRGK